MPITPKPKPVKKVKAKSRFMKRGKKSHRQLLEIELDGMVKKIVLLRDGCCVCPAPERGHSSVRQPGHLISRGKKSVKWDLHNVAEQCSSCNMLHEHYPERYTRWYVDKFGAADYMKLCEDGAKTVDLSIVELETLLSALTQIHELQLSDKSFKPRFSQREMLAGEWGMWVSSGTSSISIGAMNVTEVRI